MNARLKVLIGGLCFCAAVMFGMIYYAGHKSIRIENIQTNTEIVLLPQNETADESGLLSFRIADADGEYMRIPIPSGLHADRIQVENRYAEKQIRITLSGIKSGFYDANGIYGNLSYITGGRYESNSERTVLIFSTDRVYEVEVLWEEKCLSLEFFTPSEKYEKILVLDAAWGGEDAGIAGYINDADAEPIYAKELTLDLVKRIGTYLDDSGIRVYYTRTGDTLVTDEQRLSLANDVEADIYLRISVSGENNEDTQMYGIEAVYSNLFFDPAMPSKYVADLLVRQVTTAVNGRGNGLYAPEDSDIIMKNIKGPGITLRVGYLTNPTEAALLMQENYRDKIAAAAGEAIKEAFGE